MLPPDREPAALSPHYYRDNFHKLLDAVEDQYLDILNAEELSFYEAYRGLGFDAQCLYVRLISRVGPWFRVAQLQYPELGDLAAAVRELLDAGLAVQAQSLSVEELGRLCTLPELVQLFGVAPGEKALVLESLRLLADDERRHLQVLASADRAGVIAPAAADVVNRLQLLFFGNRYQGLTDFVLSDLGVARYYPYELDRNQRLFSRREALDAFLACAAAEDAWQQALEQDDVPAMCALAEALLQDVCDEPVAKRRRDRLYNRVARQLERLGENELASALYCRSARHPARERRARLLEAGGDLVQAEALCQRIAEEPWCEDERDAAARILPRVRRKLHGTRQPRRRDDFQQFDMALPADSGRVERSAARALQAQWDQVLYVENQLMNALFGLAFWEQIFAPVPGAFNNPYQSAPTDMYEQQFRVARAALLDDRLAELSTVSLESELTRCWRAYAGYQCRWVNWGALDENTVAAASRVIPREHLLAIWQRMLFDPRENRRGFPDLLALGARPGHYQMIEVKGPGDTLQESQKRWLRFFASADIPATVARVQWLND